MKRKKKQEKSTTTLKETAISILYVMVMSAMVWVLTYFFNKSAAECIRNTITFAVGGFLVLFLWYQSVYNETLEYDNSSHTLRFFKLFFLTFMGSIGMIFLPVASWMFLSLMVLLAMFSNTAIGLTAGSTLLLTTVSLSQYGTMHIFFLYFMTGLIGVGVFRKLDIEFKIAQPLFLSGLGAFILQTGYLIIFENQPLQWELIMMPLINLFINLVLLFLILKYFTSLGVYHIQDQYAEINDQEFPVLAELKKVNKERYFEAIHTAYLGDRIAKRLGINDKAVKGCAYYYKLARDTQKKAGKELIPLQEYYDFPDELKSVIEECIVEKYGSKEACVVLTVNEVISAIKKMQQEESEIPCEKIIGDIFQKMRYSNMLDECEISMRDLKIMEKVFVEEKLYYDFMR